jgi:hypothetical protein
MPSKLVGWQPSRFLADRAEAKRDFAWAERLDSINATAAELGTSWPLLSLDPPIRDCGRCSSDAARARRAGARVA